MKTKIISIMAIIALLAVLVVATFAFTGCDGLIIGEGEIQTQTHFITQGFTQITAGGSFVVSFRYAEEDEVASVEIQTWANFIDLFEPTVNGNTLNIRFSHRGGMMFGNAPPVVNVVAHRLVGATLSGSSRSFNWDVIQEDNFNLTISGSAQSSINFEVSNLSVTASGSSTVNMNNASLENLDITASGSSTLNFGSVVIEDNLEITASGSSVLNMAGEVQAVDITASGSSRLNMTGLDINIADVQGSGSARIYVTVHQTLTIRLTGSSRLYTGGAALVHVTRLSGSARWERVGGLACCG